MIRDPCIRCPASDPRQCPGRLAPRLCDLIDPAHPDYRPGYVDSIRAVAVERGHEPASREAIPGHAEKLAKSESTQSDVIPPKTGVPATEAIALVKAMKACPHRSVDPPCGCSGAWCGFKGGVIVSHADCFDCLRTNGGHPGSRKELVVCRYREDIAWLDHVPHDFAVTVYAKSDEPAKVTRPHRMIRLQNVGRESHSMLKHIVTRYDTLAEWTYFCQGDALFHAPDFLGRLEVEYADVCPLSRIYSRDHPSEEVHRRDRVEYHGGFQVHYGDATIAVPHSGRPTFADPSAWAHVFTTPMPTPLYFGYAAMYAVPRRRITDRPISFWQWLLSEVERSPWDFDRWSDPPLNPWQMEALWLPLFGDPTQYPHRTDYP